jgi:hypothetical protein
MEAKMEAKVVKYGKGMNSPKPYRRNLYIKVYPNLSEAISNLKNLVLSWEFETTYPEPWYHYKQCDMCVRRVKYEFEKFTQGKWVWNRRYCMRHYLIKHLNDILDTDAIESNRYLEIYVSKDLLMLSTKTNKYDYNVEINRKYAVIDVIYKGTRYTFRYNNHLNALPYLSSYLNLVLNINAFIDKILLEFLESLEYKIENKRCAGFNVFVNDVLVVPACG